MEQQDALDQSAQDFSKTGDISNSVIPKAENCAPCQKKLDYLDLKECQRARNVAILLTDSENSVREDYIGFAETEPTTFIYESIRDINHKTSVNRLDGDAKGITFKTLRFFTLAE